MDGRAPVPARRAGPLRRGHRRSARGWPPPQGLDALARPGLARPDSGQRSSLPKAGSPAAGLARAVALASAHGREWVTWEHEHGTRHVGHARQRGRQVAAHVHRADGLARLLHGAEPPLADAVVFVAGGRRQVHLVAPRAGRGQTRPTPSSAVAATASSAIATRQRPALIAGAGTRRARRRSAARRASPAPRRPG